MMCDDGTHTYTCMGGVCVCVCMMSVMFYLHCVQ